MTLQQPDVYFVERADRAFPMLVKTLFLLESKDWLRRVDGCFDELLASVFNSCSTIFTIDIYKKIKPEMSENPINIGKIATAIIVILEIFGSHYG